MPALPPKETIAADSPDNPFGGGVWPLALAWCAETAGGEFPDTMAVVDVGERCGRALGGALRMGDKGGAYERSSGRACAGTGALRL